MNALSFDHPEWLPALALGLALTVVALAVARALARGRRRRLLGSAKFPRGRRLTSDVALVVALVAIAVALAAPRSGEQVLRLSARGVDVGFLLDVSRSMAARDVAPSRLDRARRAVQEIVGRLEAGDRVALAVFASRGLLLAPLTPDHAALVDFVNAVDVDLIEPASSDLGRGVEAAIAAFEAASERPRVLVVLSDGEDPRHRDDVGGAAASAAGVRVVTIAIGSEAGSFVPDGDRVLADGSGLQVRSRRDATRLARLAEASGGAAFVADDFGRVDFAAVAELVRRELGADDGFIERRIAAVWTAPFAALAFALLLFEGLARPRRSARRPERNAHPRALRAATAAVLAAALATAASSADPGAGDLPDELAARLRTDATDPLTQLEVGLARLEAGRSEAAVRAFEAATVYAGSTPLGATAWFDLGVAHLAADDLETAREAFLRALEIDPGDEQARFNLEWSLQPTPEPTRPPEPPRAARESDAGESRPRPDAAREREPARANDTPTLTPEQRRRLLDRTRDDVGRFFGSEAMAGDEADPRAHGPAW